MNWELMWQVGPPAFAWRAALRLVSTKLARRGNTIRLPGGLLMHLPVGYSNGTEVFLTRARVDWGAEALLVRHLDPAGIFLDVGANIGYYSLLAAPCVARVYAFEPDPRNLAPLRQNAPPNVTVIPRAVAGTSGRRRFVLGVDSAISHLGEEGIEVDAVTLDEFVHGERVTGIKIDVEGFDLDALRGARRILQTDAPLVLTEFSRKQDLGALFALLEPLDYQVMAFVRTLDRWRRPTDRFMALDLRQAEHSYFKMLFLVPARLQIAFTGHLRYSGTA